MDTTPNSVEVRLRHLEKSNARWRLAAAAGMAGVIGLLVGGMGQVSRVGQADQSQSGYQYVSVGDMIYRIDKFGEISYLSLGGTAGSGVRSSRGYFNWGTVRIDQDRALSDRP